MAATSLIHGCYNTNPSPKLRNAGHVPSNPPSSSHRHSFSSNFTNFLGGLNCSWKSMSFKAHAMSATQGNVATPKDISKLKREPDHLLVLVHGIFASPSDWTYVEAELKRRVGSNFLIYASSSNTYTKTFTGIDGAGRRLADEVLQVVRKTESLKRISFLAHSLGGLFARYAIAVLYSSNACSKPNDPLNCRGETDKSTVSSKVGTIAGLEPINFITLATPHLGVRGKWQLPLLLGVPILEKLAPPIAPFFIGRTGRQLFLTDGKPSKPPLLLRMATDCEDGKFISALAVFKCRILYANVSYDHMVGWRTSSIRRETELVKVLVAEDSSIYSKSIQDKAYIRLASHWEKPPQRSLDGYKHVVDVEYCPPVSSEGPHFPPEAAKAKEAAQTAPSTQNTAEYHDLVEEEMIRGLQRVGWKKVDVSFHSALWPFFAHNNIHVKSEWLHNAGAGVVAHVADSLKQQESSHYIAASL